MNYWLLSLMVLSGSAALAAPPALSDPRWLTNRFHFRLQGESNEVYIVEGSRDLESWSPMLITVLRQSEGTLTIPASNSMQAYRAKVGTPVMGYGIQTKTHFDLGMHAFESDSFDSSDPAYSTAGQYDPAKRLDGGNIAGYAAVTNAGNARIRGSIWTGPDGSISGFGPSSSVGSSAWVDDGRTGVQPGYVRTNLLPTLPDAPPPPAGGFPIFPPGGTIDGEVYDWILPSGVYVMSSSFSMNGSQRMYVAGDVSIKFLGGLRLSSAAVIRLRPGVRLTMWVGGALRLGGQGVQGAFDATRLGVFGLPSCTNIVITTEFTGVIYAPAAPCALGPATITGSCVAESVTLTGPVSVHFDEVLRRTGTFY